MKVVNCTLPFMKGRPIGSFSVDHNTYYTIQRQVPSLRATHQNHTLIRFTWRTSCYFTAFGPAIIAPSASNNVNKISTSLTRRRRR